MLNRPQEHAACVEADCSLPVRREIRQLRHRIDRILASRLSERGLVAAYLLNIALAAKERQLKSMTERSA